MQDRNRPARALASRVAQVRWEEDAGNDLWLRYDPDIRTAVAVLPEATRRLGAAAR